MYPYINTQNSQYVHTQPNSWPKLRDGPSEDFWTLSPLSSQYPEIPSFLFFCFFLVRSLISGPHLPMPLVENHDEYIAYTEGGIFLLTDHSNALKKCLHLFCFISYLFTMGEQL